jgi:hypothetical protein
MCKKHRHLSKRIEIPGGAPAPPHYYEAPPLGVMIFRRGVCVLMIIIIIIIWRGPPHMIYVREDHVVDLIVACKMYMGVGQRHSVSV